MKSLKDQAKKLKEVKKKEDIPEEKESSTPRLVPKTSKELEADRATDEIIDRLV